MKTGKKAEQWQQCVRKDTGEKGIISLTLVQKKKERNFEIYSLFRLILFKNVK